MFWVIETRRKKKEEPQKARVTCLITINLYLGGRVNWNFPTTFKARKDVSVALFYYVGSFMVKNLNFYASQVSTQASGCLGQVHGKEC